LAKNVLVTGAAGFIGSHVVEALLRRGDKVVGIDNVNDYYSPKQKRDNLETIEQNEGDFVFVEGDLRDKELVAKIFSEESFNCVAHLAAMAGVRASIEQPQLYYDVNVGGLINLLDAALASSQASERPHFVAASTSSVYGATAAIPFREDDPCNTPLAPYSASKRAAELLGYTYNHLHGTKYTSLRFFTVYGPRNRPDMMAFKLLDSVFSGRPVPLYEGKDIRRDWTFVEDVVDGVVRAVDRPFDYELINIGRGEPVDLHAFVKTIETASGRSATLKSEPMPKADMSVTYADISKARTLLGYEPATSVNEGVERLLAWFTSRPGFSA
jgi:UDP-glucuronate 4-epimerase